MQVQEISYNETIKERGFGKSLTIKASIIEGENLIEALAKLKTLVKTELRK